MSSGSLGFATSPVSVKPFCPLWKNALESYPERSLEVGGAEWRMEAKDTHYLKTANSTD